jgi:NADPH-dependent curcumin reductase CurA
MKKVRVQDLTPRCDVTVTVNRQWRLRERPAGMVNVGHFFSREEPVPVPTPGEVLVRTLYVSFDPAMRAFLNDRPSYVGPQPVGEVMRAGAIGQVVESRADGFVAGEIVFGAFGWQEYATAAATALMKLSPRRPLTDYMSVLGGTGLTAYFGLLEVGRAQAGETVVVSGAAGATGSTVVQLARIIGARVVAIAGGPDKCRWTVDALGATASIDYKSDDVARRLPELCPDGIDVYFDNVGGSILEAAIDRMKVHGRIALCGMISTYNDAAPAPGPSNLFELIAHRVRMEGFLVPDFASRFAEARQALEQWMDEGRLQAFVDVQEGFENIPATFLRIFTGANVGKQTLKLADPPLPIVSG